MKTISTSSITIQLNFEYPEYIGLNDSKQYLSVLTDFGDFEPFWDTETLTRYLIPSQRKISAENIMADNAIESFKNAATPTMTLGAVANWILSGSLQ